MKVTHYGRTRTLPANLPVSIDGHVSEAVKTDYGIVLWAPSHPDQPAFLLLRDDEDHDLHSVHGSLKRLILTLVLKLGEAETKAKAGLQGLAQRALTAGVN